MSSPDPLAYGCPAPAPFSAPDAIGWGWRKFKFFIGPVMIGVALYVASVVVTSALGGISSFGSAIVTEASADQRVVIVDSAVQLVVQVLGTLVGIVLTGAGARAALDVADGYQYDFLGALRRIPILKLIAAQLLIAVAFMLYTGALIALGFLLGFELGVSLWVLVPVGVVLLLLPMLIVGLLTMFTPWAVVDDPNRSIIGSITTSATLVRTHLGDSLALAILCCLVGLAGLLACCIGLLAAYPIVYFAFAHAYRRFQGRPVAP